MHRWFNWALIFLAIFNNSLVLGSELPFQYFSRLPQYQRPVISPEGSNVAFIYNDIKRGVSILTALDTTTGKVKYLNQSDNEKVQIKWYQWANEKTLLVSARYASRRSGTDVIETRLLSFDVRQNSEGMQELIRPRTRGSHSQHFSQFQDNVIDILPDDPDHIMVAVDLDRPTLPSVYKLNINNRQMSRIEKGKMKVRDWLTDRQHRLRVGFFVDYNTGEAGTLIRQLGSDNWQPYFKYNALTEPEITPVGFARDPNILYFKRYNADKLALYKINLKTNEEELMFEDPQHDVDGELLYSNKINDAIGITHRNSASGRHYWHQDRIKFQQSIDITLPNTTNYLVEFSVDESKYILYTENDFTPGIYYLGDRTKNTILPLFKQYPELIPEKLTKHQRITYKARDGVEIEGLLTLPKNVEGPIATIIHPHGGPHARDSRGFDYWTSFFANRGYAVFRPNFRGSTGYGYEFAQSQMKSWGLEMQDDLEDAVNHLVKRGITDKSKVCIVGGSYGGYAAMMGIVKTPDLYKCAVSYAGVSNLRSLVNDSRRYINSKFVKNQIGNDSDDLKRRSPYYNVNNINVPLLLLHGEDDRVVDVKHSTMMADEMEDENKQVEYIELENGTHYLSIQRNRNKVFESMDRFLKANLK